ncbi:hypothetical protein P5673_025231 [Acropora cervicornis]|uniref:Uncharacterized protein n=1 Tax=Acropora cervicornis TaxID=6130 RepID=A0AAD9UXK7_ACRCE|nr:hypothetical protein P5673_025231 [Acropora cervicornis]
MHGLQKKSNESAGGSTEKIRRSGGDAVEFLKENVQSEYSIRQQGLELQRKEQEARARQQELQIELLRKQTEQQVQISQAWMIVMQNLVFSKVLLYPELSEIIDRIAASLEVRSAAKANFINPRDHHDEYP